jgi:hypothetical protein
MVQKAVGDRTLRGNGPILDKTKLDGGRIIGCGGSAFCFSRYNCKGAYCAYIS